MSYKGISLVAKYYGRSLLEESIFIISSKSFGTIETLKNASFCKKWFYNKSKNNDHVNKHFYAVTANTERAKEFGVKEKNIFPIWDLNKQ